MPARLEADITALRPGPLGQRLCVWHLPPAPVAPLSLIVHVHAFAEEMNKSRRMVNLQSRALAAAGHAVLRVDLLGCGDSAGDLADATWQEWLSDVQAAMALARERHAHHWPGVQTPPLWLWGQRMGALLAAQAAAAGACHLLLWQPAANGKALLQQFLRLDSAAALMGRTAEGRPSAKEELAAGRSAQVAGYTLSPGLAQGLEAARLQPPEAAPGARLVWLDVHTQQPAEPSPVVRQALAEWSAAGWRTQHRAVQGPAFWQTTEIEDAPALIGATTQALQGDGAEPAAPQSAPTPAAVLA